MPLYSCCLFLVVSQTVSQKHQARIWLDTAACAHVRHSVRVVPLLIKLPCEHTGRRASRAKRGGERWWFSCVRGSCVVVVLLIKATRCCLVAMPVRILFTHMTAAGPGGEIPYPCARSSCVRGLSVALVLVLLARQQIFYSFVCTTGTV